MHTYTLQREQWVERPLQRVFPFFARPENLALITPPGYDFRLLTHRPVKMEQVRIIDNTIPIFTMPVRWRTLITRYDPPWCFVDEQISGPYSFWHHTHTFSEHNGGTLLEDSVRYALPMLLAGPARGIAHALYVRPMLERIFDYRREVFDDLFGSRKTGASRSEPVSPVREEVVL